MQKKETSATGVKRKRSKAKAKPKPKLQIAAKPAPKVEKEEIDYEKVNAFINTQSRKNKWFDRHIVYTGNRTKIKCDDIPIIRAWESGKNKRSIAFTRMENSIGLVQLQKDGVVGLNLSQIISEDYTQLDDKEHADIIKEILKKARFFKSDIIMVFGGGITFNGEEIIKLLSDEYTFQFIKNNTTKRKWVVEIVDNNKDKRNLKFTPIGK